MSSNHVTKQKRRDSNLQSNPLAVPKIVCSLLLRTILTATPTRTPYFRHWRWSCSLPAPSSLEFEFQLRHKTKKTPYWVSFLFGGEGETRTLAPVSRPTPLAGAPRHQLEYFSIGNLFRLLLN